MRAEADDDAGGLEGGRVTSSGRGGGGGGGGGGAAAGAGGGARPAAPPSFRVLLPAYGADTICAVFHGYLLREGFEATAAALAREMAQRGLSGGRGAGAVAAVRGPRRR
jgi:hypothetical protein